jgi:hypothetical protein
MRALRRTRPALKKGYQNMGGLSTAARATSLVQA